MQAKNIRARRYARNAIDLLDSGTSLIKVKIGLRGVLAQDPENIPTFASLYANTKPADLRADLVLVSQDGNPPPTRKATNPPKHAATPSASEQRRIALLVEEIRRRFDYDPFTGDLKWRIRHRGHSPGDPAGNRNNFDTVQVVIRGLRLSGSYVAWLHYHGSDPDGKVRRVKGAGTDAIKNLYVVEGSR